MRLRLPDDWLRLPLFAPLLFPQPVRQLDLGALPMLALCRRELGHTSTAGAATVHAAALRSADGQLLARFPADFRAALARAAGAATLQRALQADLGGMPVASPACGGRPSFFSVSAIASEDIAGRPHGPPSTLTPRQRRFGGTCARFKPVPRIGFSAVKERKTINISVWCAALELLTYAASMHHHSPRKDIASPNRWLCSAARPMAQQAPSTALSTCLLIKQLSRQLVAGCIQLTSALSLRLPFSLRS